MVKKCISANKERQIVWERQFVEHLKTAGWFGQKPNKYEIWVKNVLHKSMDPIIFNS